MSLAGPAVLSFLTNAALATSVASGVYGVASAASSSSPKIQSPASLPKPPSAEAAAGKAEEVIKKKRAAMTQSIYTSPLGVAGEAQVVRKTLLGQ